MISRVRIRDRWTRLRGPLVLLTLAVSGCAGGASGPSASVGAFDGRYAGPFLLSAAASADLCPASQTGQAVMIVRGGRARLDVAQTAYFSGNVGPGGGLILTSGQGFAALINGRIANGTYVAAGSGDCQYQVRLTRISTAAGSS